MAAAAPIISPASARPARAVQRPGRRHQQDQDEGELALAGSCRRSASRRATGCPRAGRASFNSGRPVGHDRQAGQERRQRDQVPGEHGIGQVEPRHGQGQQHRGRRMGIVRRCRAPSRPADVPGTAASSRRGENTPAGRPGNLRGGPLLVEVRALVRAGPQPPGVLAPSRAHATAPAIRHRMTIARRGPRRWRPALPAPGHCATHRVRPPSGIVPTRASPIAADESRSFGSATTDQ